MSEKKKPSKILLFQQAIDSVEDQEPLNLDLVAKLLQQTPFVAKVEGFEHKSLDVVEFRNVIQGSRCDGTIHCVETLVTGMTKRTSIDVVAFYKEGKEGNPAELRIFQIGRRYLTQPDPEMVSKNKTEILKIVQTWAVEESVYKMALPSYDNVAWAFELSYPFRHPNPMSVIILNPEGKDFIVVQIAIKMSPQHVSALTIGDSNLFEGFYRSLKEIFLSADVSYNINQEQRAWVVSNQIYFDGLSKDKMFGEIRKVYNAVIHGNVLIDRIIHEAGINLADFNGNQVKKQDQAGIQDRNYFLEGLEMMVRDVSQALWEVEKNAIIVTPKVIPNLLDPIATIAYEKKGAKFLYITDWDLERYGEILKKMRILGNVDFKHISEIRGYWFIIIDDEEIILGAEGDEPENVFATGSTNPAFIKAYSNLIRSLIINTAKPVMLR